MNIENNSKRIDSFTMRAMIAMIAIGAISAMGASIITMLSHLGCLSYDILSSMDFPRQFT